MSLKSNSLLALFFISIVFKRIYTLISSLQDLRKQTFVTDIEGV